MIQQPTFSWEQFGADVIVSILGTLGAAGIAYLIYRLSRNDQKKTEEAKRKQEEQDDRIKSHRMLVALMGELDTNLKIIETVRDETSPISMNLMSSTLSSYYPLFGLLSIEVGEAMHKALMAINAYNHAGAKARTEMFSATEEALEKALSKLATLTRAEGFMEPEWTGEQPQRRP